MIKLPEGVKMVMPGDNIKMHRSSSSHRWPSKSSMRFAIREGGRTVGAGVVTKIIE